MGRELKFRAWHTDSKVLFEVLAIAFQKKILVVKWHGAERAIDIKQFEIMQFTGYFDKNSKEIFEGDKVTSFNKSYEDTVSVNEVVFDKGCWHLRSKGKNDIPLYNYKTSELEITGNKFQ